MKISPKDLPAHIAEALAPRTFAQERPEDGQRFEMQYFGKWIKATLHNDGGSSPDWLDAEGWTCSELVEYRLDTLWRPILEIEDDTPEPERELPEPKRGSYFIVEGRLAYKSTGKECWRYRADENGITKHENYQLLAALPADWTPLPDLIAKAARAGELEATLGIYRASNDDLKAQLQARDSRIAELDEALGTVERDADEMADQCYELQAKIKQQDADVESLKLRLSAMITARDELQEKLGEIAGIAREASE